jgi:hypothetical protein
MEVRFTRRKCSKISSVTFSAGRISAMPALLTRIIGGPSSFSIVATSRSTYPVLETSAWTGMAYCADRFTNLVGGLGVGVVVYGYICPGVGQSKSDGFADATACTGYEGDAVG